MPENGNTRTRYAVTNEADGVQVTVRSVKYHRNGVGGRPYAVARFDAAWDTRGEMGNLERWVAVLPYAPDPDDGGVAGSEYLCDEVLVLNPHDIRVTMRGADFFGPALCPAVSRWLTNSLHRAARRVEREAQRRDRWSTDAAAALDAALADEAMGPGMTGGRS